MNVKGRDEASAAIQYLLLSKIEALQGYNILKGNNLLKVMLLDMGAGTSDIVIGEFGAIGKIFSVIATYPGADDDICYGGKNLMTRYWV